MKTLITDRDVLAGRVGATIVLDENTILTPSARDRAVRLGIAIVEPGRTPAPASAAAAAFPDGVADGTYLVRVESGRVVVCHAATGPGLTRAAR